MTDGSADGTVRIEAPNEQAAEEIDRLLYEIAERPQLYEHLQYGEEFVESEVVVRGE